jgi:ferredoxin-NADP reductase
VKRLRWQTATLVERHEESPTAWTLVFDVPGWQGHLAGQHVDVRLTAADGYSTERSYSVASAPDTGRVELTVQCVPGGEVSPYLVDDLAIGDAVEIRGPVGGWFVRRPEETDPVLLIAGGSGVVPLISMIRMRNARGSRVPFRLLYSVRGPADRLYGAELDRGAPGLDTTWVYTRVAPEGGRRPAGRLTAEDLIGWGWPAAFRPTCYVCGPTGFVETAAGMLVALGHQPARIRTERFGPTGG